MLNAEANAQWRLSGESIKNNELIKGLYYLYKTLRNINIENEIEKQKWIGIINSWRSTLLDRLGLKELQLLVFENINLLEYICDINYSSNEIVKDLYPQKLLKYLRMKGLFSFNKFYDRFILFDMLMEENNINELEFWIEYALLHLGIDEEAIEYKCLLLFKNKKYSDLIDFTNRFHKIRTPLMQEIELEAYIKIRDFDYVLNNVNQYTITEDKKNYYEVCALHEKNAIKNNCMDKLKSAYLNIIINNSNFTLLTFSPYVQKYITKGIGTKKVYHYTDANALLNIIEKNEIWATRQDFLNDYKEQNYIMDILNNNIIIEDEIIGRIKSAIKRFIQNKQHILCIENCGDLLNEFIDNSISRDYFNQIYIFSCSINKDNLTLWGNYSNFNGYNLGFNTNMSEISVNACNYHYVIEGKVQYLSEKAGAKVINKMINEIIHDMSELRINNTLIEKVIIAHILLFSNFIKHATMKHEEEYRFLFINASNDSRINTIHEIEKPNIRVKNGSLIPFIKINFPCKKILNTITIGPTNSLDIAEKGVYTLLEREGYINTKDIVAKSRLTLRY